jgi:hypothetical protein
VITYSFTGNQPASDLFNCVTNFINNVVITRFRVNYSEILWYSIGLVTTMEFKGLLLRFSRSFQSSLWIQYLRCQTIRYSEDNSNLMHANNLKTILIQFRTNFHTEWHVWNMVQLFLHVSINEAKNSSVYESNESNHKLAMTKDPNDCGLNIWFRINCKNRITRKIDFLTVELTFEEWNHFIFLVF